MRAGAGQRDLARVHPASPDPRLEAAERRRRKALDEVDTLDADVERIARELAQFSARYEAAMAGPFSELADAERLVRRLQSLEDELARLGRVLSGAAPALRRRGGPASRVRSGPGIPAAPGREGEEAQAGEEDVEAAEVEVLADEAELKRLHRRLARMFHPDLAEDDAERGRLSGLMARVNEAYSRGDRSALELLAERAGAGDLDGDVSTEDRIAHAERRAESLSGVAAALRRERERLLATATARLREEAERRKGEGGDLVEDMRRDVEADAAAARDDARRRLSRVAASAADVARRWRSAMTGLVLRGGRGLRPFDPVMESALVRRGALHLERARAGAAARDLARRLEEAAEAAPWEVAVTLMAFFAEAARRPPDSLATPEAWRERWEILRGRWPAAPDFERLLGRLPRSLGLELGLRSSPGNIVAGPQLASAELLPGVRIALGRASVAAVAREVLSALGPKAPCPRCRRRTLALHLMRTRGLDEVHGLACPRCGAILRSYWRYGETDGLEALAPLALELGLVAERALRLAGAGVAFQMLPSQAAGLNAGRLAALFEELYLVPCKVEMPPGRLGIRAGRTWLSRSARMPQRGAVLDVRPGRGAPDAEELLETLRARIAKRFRAGPARTGGTL